MLALYLLVSDLFCSAITMIQHFVVLLSSAIAISELLYNERSAPPQQRIKHVRSLQEDAITYDHVLVETSSCDYVSKAFFQSYSSATVFSSKT